MTIYQPQETGFWVDPVLASQEYNQADKLSTLSLAAAISGWVIFPLFGSTAAVITARIAKEKIRAIGNPAYTEKFQGRIRAALILGWIPLGIFMFSGVAFVTGLCFILALGGS